MKKLFQPHFDEVKKPPLTKDDLSPIQLDIYAGKICPYCNGSTVSKTAKEIYGSYLKASMASKMFIACVNYPRCNSYVGTHDATGIALGRLAGSQLRKIKSKSKDVFNQIWTNKHMNRDEAYEQLAEFLNIDRELAHFAYFNIATCEIVYDWARKRYASFASQTFFKNNIQK